MAWITQVIRCDVGLERRGTAPLLSTSIPFFHFDRYSTIAAIAPGSEAQGKGARTSCLGEDEECLLTRKQTEATPDMEQQGY